MMMHHCDTASHDSALSGMSGGHSVMLVAHLAAAVVAGAWLVAGGAGFLDVADTRGTASPRRMADSHRGVPQRRRRRTRELSVASARLGRTLCNS